jgi:hypothetical protein
MTTLVNSAVSPADLGSFSYSAPVNVTMPSAQAGDTVVLYAVQASSTANFSLTGDGGQAWVGADVANSSLHRGLWHCVYNGTWSGNVTVTSTVSAVFSTVVLVLRPSTANHTVVLDLPANNRAVSAPTTPFDVTIPAAATASTQRDNAIAFAIWASYDDNTWALQTSGWTNLNSQAQYRNGTAFSVSVAHKTLATAGAIGAVTNRQATLGGDTTAWDAFAFSEVLTSTINQNLGMARRFRGPISTAAGWALPSTASADAIDVGDWFFSGTQATLSLWAFFEYLPGTYAPRLWCKFDQTGSTSTNGFDFLLGVEEYPSTGNTNKLRVRWNNSSGTQVGSTVLTTGTWYHICCTFNAGTGLIYLNGTRETESTTTFSNAAAFSTVADRRVTIGNNPINPTLTKRRDDAPYCYIEHPAAWNAVLTADEVRSLSQRASPLAIRSSALKFYMPNLGASAPIDIIGGVTGTVYNTVTGDQSLPISMARRFRQTFVSAVAAIRRRFIFTT